MPQPRQDKLLKSIATSTTNMPSLYLYRIESPWLKMWVCFHLN